MAVTRAANVIKMTADNDSVAGPLRITGIKCVETSGSAGATVLLKKGSTGGVVVYEARVAQSADNWADVFLNVPADGLWLDITGAATVYLYV